MDITEFLSADREPMPQWLENYNPANPPRVSKILKSRVVYYPGAGQDGSLVKLLNKAQAAHVFLYVDYGYSKEQMDLLLGNDVFLGYHLLDSRSVTEKELTPNGARMHVTMDEVRERSRTFEVDYRYVNNRAGSGFCHLRVYERNADRDESHGAKRFVMLYLGADANAAFDAIIGNGYANLFALLAENYGFGNEYGTFLGGSVLELIMLKTGKYPKYLLTNKAEQPDGYEGPLAFSPAGREGRERVLFRKR